ncbi:FAD-binding oxidoreductase [Paenibacillus sp. PR3]|uniref:FAD-binding oxidoreductase n=1 Tax=Paenibacillus terricola TaxID=2763503 RepID=A0ABR8N341_9BACL|nr:FAD-dependent oxidoreductase [Paenibacillus terricola]MBD3922573.1 FAD-binding oxidoreductase [Paenibacillus terricola]
MTRKQLHAGSMYWPTTTTRPAPSYDMLGERSVQCDVAIIGGGMSGISNGHAFASQGLRTVVLERETIAGGSSSANTGLIQFSNDIMLTDLADQIGEHRAVLFYKACKDAVKQLDALTERLPQRGGFKQRSSLYLASSEQEVPKLRREYEILHKHGFDVEWWSSQQIRAHFPFTKPAAIVMHGDAELNPFVFITELAEDAVRQGLTIYEHTDVVAQHTNDDGHLLTTSDGGTIAAKHVIFAIGYEPEELRSKLIKSDLNRSFVIVTVPQDAPLVVWHERMMIWETARPYLYMRTTQDNRIIIGGLDEDPSEPIEGAIARNKRNDKLHDRLMQMFPTLTAPIEYEWSATFGESCDGLPFIGRDPVRSNVYYCLGYGGNGTVYSLIGCQLLYELIQGRSSPIADIVRLDRPSILSI